MDDYKKLREEGKAKIANLANDMARQINQNIDSLDRGKVLAEALVELQTDKRGASVLRGVDLEWMIDALVSRSIPQCLNELNAIYDKMVEHGFVDGKTFDWNDLDNWITVNRTDYPRVMTFGSQNHSWIAIFNQIGGGSYQRVDVSVYRMYEVPTKDHMMCEPENGETKVEYAQRASETFEQYYTDNIKRNPYVRRPDFKWFEDTGFDLEKIRKNCFISPIIKYDSFHHETFGEVVSNQSLYRLSDIWCLFFETETALLAIEEEPDFKK